MVAMMRPKYLRCLNAWLAAATFVVAVAGLSTQTALAIREGVRGNTPVADPGWATGAAAVFNNRARTSYWVGPDPGYYSAEYSGDATALGTVLADFAQVEAKSRRLVLRDGVRSSAFKQKMDWIFNVWVPTAWERPTGAAVTRTFFRNPDKCPPPEIIVYTGGNVRWSDVTVPTGIEVIDERLVAHGFTLPTQRCSKARSLILPPSSRLSRGSAHSHRSQTTRERSSTLPLSKPSLTARDAGH
jgi:hypothetical protein